MDRFIGLDAHSSSCTFAVMGPSGKRLRSDVIETNGRSLIEYLKQIPGRRRLCLEEGTCSAWLFELLSPHVDELIVTAVTEKSPRKSDREDAFVLANQLRTGSIGRRVYKNPRAYVALRALVQVHLKLVSDYTRTQNRLTSLFRARGMAVPRNIDSAAVKRLPVRLRLAATRLLDSRNFTADLRAEAEADVCREAHKHSITRVLETAPGMGTIRVARLVATVIEPNRFRTSRQFWAYCGLAIVTRASAEWRQGTTGRWERIRTPMPRGLNRNHNRVLKDVFKGAATTVITRLPEDPLHADYRRLIAGGTKPHLAKLTISRKLAAMTLAMWKRGEAYKPESYRSKS